MASLNFSGDKWLDFSPPKPQRFISVLSASSMTPASISTSTSISTSASSSASSVLNFSSSNGDNNNNKPKIVFRAVKVDDGAYDWASTAALQQQYSNGNQQIKSNNRQIDPKSDHYQLKHPNHTTGAAASSYHSHQISGYKIPPDIADTDAQVSFLKNLGNIERAAKWQYDVARKKWSFSIILIKVEKHPFSEGCMRSAFMVDDLTQSDENHRKWVLKLPRNPLEYEEQIWQDVQVQSVSRLWAFKYNEHPAVSKKIEIIDCCALQLVDRPDKPLASLERYISGEYIKWTNNWEFADCRRNTPHTFSHFTYEASGHRLLVCDMQGAGDVYTDTQIHSVDGVFGNGNLGQDGIDAFKRSHVCNQLCHGLGLPCIRPSSSTKDEALARSGTPPLIKSPVAASISASQYRNATCADYSRFMTEKKGSPFKDMILTATKRHHLKLVSPVKK